MSKLIVLMAALIAPAAVALADSPFTFEFEEVGPGVWAGVRPDGIRFPVMGNVTFVVSDDGVVVFDGGGMPTMSDQVIEKIRSVTDSPVTHVITSHWHGDHNFGVFRFGQEFDNVEFVAHAFTRDMMQSSKLNYIDRQRDYLQRNRERFEQVVRSGVDDDGKEYSPVARDIYRRILADGGVIETEYQLARVTPPNVVIQDDYVIESGGRRIEIRHMGHGNTAGDLIMWLPEERIVATGDIVVLPSPFAFNVPPRAWVETLKRIVALDYEVMVPGHGPVQRTADYVDLLIEAATSIADQRDELVAAGVETEKIPESLDLSSFESRFTHEDEYIRFRYDMWFADPLRAAAVKALDDGPIVPVPAPEVVAFDGDRWHFDSSEHETVEYLGRQALRLKGGFAVLPDLEIRNGVVEFDIAMPNERAFAGAMFRYVDEDNFENFYLRPHQSGNVDANQYQPVFNGHSAWQLYHGEGYGAAVDYRYDEWQTVRIVYGGSQAEVYIDSQEPVLKVRDLKRGELAGAVGLMAADFAAVHFSRFRYANLAEAWAFPPLPAVDIDEDMIRSWQVSDAVSSELLKGVTRLDNGLLDPLDFTTVKSEPNGIVNLAETIGPGEEGSTVLARVSVKADEAGIRMLSLGYSDTATVYLNDELLYRGDNTYQSRDYRYLGTIGLFDHVALPLRAGNNDIVIAVSELFGGWGIVGKLSKP